MNEVIWSVQTSNDESTLKQVNCNHKVYSG